jgi:hypothetical protein
LSTGHGMCVRLQVFFGHYRGVCNGQKNFVMARPLHFCNGRDKKTHTRIDFLPFWTITCNGRSCNGRLHTRNNLITALTLTYLFWRNRNIHFFFTFFRSKTRKMVICLKKR